MLMLKLGLKMGYAPGQVTSGGSIPASIMVTGQRPDLVLVDRRTSPSTVHLVELTVPWDFTRNIEAARDRKVERYTSLVADIKATGLKCHLHPLEIRARGFIDNRNRGTLAWICLLICLYEYYTYLLCTFIREAIKKNH